MRLYTLQTVETRRRSWRIPAPDAASAERALRASLPPGVRIIDHATPCDHSANAASAEGALARLLGTDYLHYDGAAQKIEDWILRAREHLAAGGFALDQTNALLAPAGLRVYPGDMIWIASAASCPAMAMIFAGTQWAGQGLTNALRQMKGADLANLTFAGKRARAVGLPLSAVFAIQPERISA
jgi:hypothetical protein